MDSVDDRELEAVDANTDVEDEWLLSDDGWDFEIEHLPVLHALRGETQADNEAHCTARIAFLNLLSTHPKTIEWFEHWQRSLPLGGAALAAADILDELARLLGYSNRFQLWTPAALSILNQDSFTVTVPDDTDPVEIERLRRLPSIAADALNRMYGELGGDYSEMSHSSVELVRQTFGLTWPWVAVELVQLWLITTLSGAMGRHGRINYWYEPPTALNAPMEPFQFSFESRPDESVLECLTRFTDAVVSTALPAFADAIKRASASVPVIRRGKMSNPERIEMYTNWFFRNRLCGESIRSIALSVPGGNDDTRSQVRRGIKRAEFWLGLSVYTWEDPGENSNEAA